MKEKTIIIKKDKIIFPNGYFFKQSPINKKKVINATEISEFNLNTIPPSLIYNKEEIIFLSSDLKTEIKNFATSNQIPIINRLDIWKNINQPYLDTEFKDEDNSVCLKLLNEIGISEKEVEKIRGKVSKTMFLNFFFWEWIYLGLFDYLNWTFLTKKKYWWTMTIGLKSYTNEQRNHTKRN